MKRPLPRTARRERTRGLRGGLRLFGVVTGGSAKVARESSVRAQFGLGCGRARLELLT